MPFTFPMQVEIWVEDADEARDVAESICKQVFDRDEVVTVATEHPCEGSLSMSRLEKRGASHPRSQKR